MVNRPEGEGVGVRGGRHTSAPTPAPHCGRVPNNPPPPLFSAAAEKKFPWIDESRKREMADPNSKVAWICRIQAGIGTEDDLKRISGLFAASQHKKSGIDS
jgi:hypothetical protein